MIKVTELQEWASDLKPVLFDINISLDNIFFLKQGNLSKFRLNNNEGYLSLLYQQHFILIIQLAKIFSSMNNTHKRNINKLCNRFQNEDLDKQIKLILQTNTSNPNNGFKSKKDILTAIDDIKIDLKANSENIKSIMSLRNEVFAHTDPFAKEEQITIDQLTNLSKLSNKIYNTLFGRVLGEYFNPQMTHQYGLKSLIESLDEA